MIMSGYEQLSMFTMNVEQVTATCCMDGGFSRRNPGKAVKLVYKVFVHPAHKSRRRQDFSVYPI